MTEVSGGVTGISRAYGGIKPGSCNQMVSNVRLQVGMAKYLSTHSHRSHCAATNVT